MSQMLKPNPDDPLRVRRILALGAAFNGFYGIVPLVAWLNLSLHMNADLCESILHYTLALMTGLVAPYIYGVHRQGEE